MRWILGCLICSIGVSLVQPAFAAENISRRDAFLLLWQSIRRPAEETRETPYADVPKGSPGFTEITYAKSRGILGDYESFRPNDTVTLQDALVWMFRTRNVADVDELTVETLPELLEKYPLAYAEADLNIPLGTSEDLLYMMQKFDTMLAEEVTGASSYGIAFHGKGTAFGETFDMNAMTAAHRTFPHNTMVEVTNVVNGKKVIVRINDRGPFVEGRNIDLSVAAFGAISHKSSGVLQVQIRRLGDVNLVNGCSGALRREQQRVTKGTILTKGVPHVLPLGETLTLSSDSNFVVRTVTYPDGNTVRIEDWVHPEESFTLKPSVTGVYRLLLGSVNGRKRPMDMKVVECAN